MNACFGMLSFITVIVFNISQVDHAVNTNGKPQEEKLLSLRSTDLRWTWPTIGASSSILKMLTTICGRSVWRWEVNYGEQE